ncbi:MAG: PEP-CTERM system TPR-repeat protein PrsT [Gammaproteobacteria bacterium]|nr:PEP-CTERM system TPR-repeat protein PrsT [Gammaproteobacteria bacterium]MDH3768058.1 PEP-CTERM system TPR-repeat protein PrsT [Gammaproteobacteria bacterium]
MSKLFSEYTRSALLLLFILSFGFACADDATKIERAKEFRSLAQYRAATIELKNVLRSDADNAEARALLGEIAMLTGDTATAVKELRRARELGASADSYLVALARAVLREGRFQEVVIFDPESLVDIDKRAALLALIGTAELERGDQQLAEEKFGAALGLVPEQPDALIGKARLAEERGDVEAAAAELEQMLRAHPDHPEGLAALGRLQHEMGEFAAAEENLRKALVIVDQSGRAHERIMYMAALIDVLIAREKSAEAQVLANDMMTKTSQHPLSLFLGARADYAAKDFDGAIDKAERIITVHPVAEPPRLLLVAAALAIGNEALAATHLQTVVNVNPGNEKARKVLAHVRMQMGDPNEALALLEPLLVGGTNDAQLLGLASTATIRSGDTKGGLELMERTVEAGEDDPAILLQAAANFLASGELDRAIELLESLPEADRVGHRELLLVLALLKKGDKEAARAQVQSVIEKRPESNEAYRLLGAFHLAVRELNEARVAFKKALEIDPDDTTSVMNLARVDIADEQPEQAEAQLEKFLERKPGDPQVLTALARIANSSGDTEKGIQLLERAHAANPDVLLPALALARSYLRTGKLELAHERASQAARIAPSNHEGHLLMGIVLLQDQRHSEALGPLARAVELSPNRAQAHYHLARAQEASGRAEASVDSYRKAVELDGKFQPALAELIGIEITRGDLNSALLLARQMVEGHPDDFKSHLLEADVHVARKDMNAAMESLDKAAALDYNRIIVGKRYELKRRMGDAEPWAELEQWVEDNPDDLMGRKGLAQAYLQSGMNERAIEIYEQLMASEPSADIASTLAKIERRGGDLDAAVDWLGKAIELKPGDMQLGAILAGIEAQRGNTKLAVNLVRDLRKEFPDATELYALEGEVLLANKDYKRSTRAFDRAIEAEPSEALVLKRYASAKLAGDEDAWRGLESWFSRNPDDLRIGIQLAQAYSERDWNDESIDVYRTLLDADPDNFLALNNIAWVYVLRGSDGDLQLALKAASKAHELKPDIAAIADTYGWILLKDGQNDKALKLLVQAADGADTDPEIRYHLAAALGANDRNSEAISILDGLLAGDRTFESREDAEILRRRLSP